MSFLMFWNTFNDTVLGYADNSFRNLAVFLKSQLKIIQNVRCTVVGYRTRLRIRQKRENIFFCTKRITPEDISQISYDLFEIHGLFGLLKF